MIAPSSDQFQRTQISADIKRWLLTTSQLFETSHYLCYSLFAIIRYSGFPDTLLKSAFQKSVF